MKTKKPTLTWRNLLASAPYFSSAIVDANWEGDIDKYSPEPRALMHYLEFNGQISNGGVMQYFYNTAFSTPNFDEIGGYIAELPELEPVLGIVRSVFSKWNDKKEATTRARQTDEWPEDLFNDDEFTDLENAFYDINHKIDLALDQAILKDPSRFFNIVAPKTITGKGIETAEQHGAKMRFVDGYPEGPNLIKVKNGDAMVWITQNRTRLDYRSYNPFNFEGATADYGWIDYPSMRTSSTHYANGELELVENQIAGSYNHGSNETLKKGKSEYISFYFKNKEILNGFKERGKSQKKHWVFYTESDKVHFESSSLWQRITRLIC